VKVHGSATNGAEAFDFTIEPFVFGGVSLYIKYRGPEESNVTSGGVWPDVEKAKAMAEQTARQLLRGATVVWTPE
jgi:hypothetical protein